MNAEQLSKVGSDLVRRCGTRDPFQIANALGITVMDDCENLGSLKGMYCIVKRNRFIFLNKDLSPQMKRIVCAHEIGHDRLRRALAKKHGLQEFVLYDMATKPEYLCYARENPIIWEIPTHILYGEKDNLTAYGTIFEFVQRTNSTLSIMKNGEHWFHTDEQMKFLDEWIIKSSK